MYRVVVETDGKKYPLLNKILRLINPTLQEKAGNSPNYLKFTISPKHPNVSKIDMLRSEIFVYEDGQEIFRGRSVTSEESFNRTNHLTCESDLAYFCDSVVRPFEFKGTALEFLSELVKSHNAQVEEKKRFTLGNVNAIGTIGLIEVSISEYPNTLDCMRDNVVSLNGGYLRTRYEAGVRYLDYVNDAGGTNEQVIRYGVNLIDYSKKRDITTYCTALIPTGADMDVTDSDGTTHTETVNITSVNNGVDYIYDPEAQEINGWIFKHIKFDDVTDPEALLMKARAYLEECIYLNDVLKLTAFDLANTGVDISRLKTGCWTRVKSRPHGVDVTYMLEERLRYLQEPGKDVISLGGTESTLSGSTAKAQKELSARVHQIASSTSREINRKVENATQLIMGGLGGYVVIGRAEDGHPEEILIMDAPNKENAENVIRLNKNGLGFSNAGYKGPYQNAWTIDGNLVADFITTGTMLADRIRGGSLVLGGEDIGRDGEIVILDEDGEEIGRWDKDGFEVGEFRVSAGSLYEIVSADGTFRAATGNYPGGKTGVLEIRSKNGNDWVKIVGGLISTSGVMSASAFSGTSQSASYMYDLRLGKSWWGGWTISQTVHKLWNKVNKLAEIIDDQWNDHSGIYDALERWDDRNDDASSW